LKLSLNKYYFKDKDPKTQDMEPTLADGAHTTCSPYVQCTKTLWKVQWIV